MATKTMDASEVSEAEKIPFERLVEKRGVAHLLYVVADIVWGEELGHGHDRFDKKDVALEKAWSHIEWAVRRLADEAYHLERTAEDEDAEVEA